jgi:thioredoxin 1
LQDAVILIQGQFSVSKRYYIISAIFFFFIGCSRNEKAYENKIIGSVASIEQVNALVANSETGLIAFDFYANWCGPCRTLAPTLEAVAQENQSRVKFYRINIDNVPQAAQLFKVDRIPFVVFIKNKEVIAEFAGIQPRVTYTDAIAANSVKPAMQKNPADTSS